MGKPWKNLVMFLAITALACIGGLLGDEAVPEAPPEDVIAQLAAIESASTPAPNVPVDPLRSSPTGPIRPGCGDYRFLVTLQTDATTVAMRVSGPGNAVDVIWTLEGPGMAWLKPHSGPRVFNDDNRDLFGIENNTGQEWVEARFILLVSGVRQGQKLVLEMGHENPGERGTQVRIEHLPYGAQAPGAIAAEWNIASEGETRTLDVCAFPPMPTVIQEKPILPPKVVAFFYPWWGSKAEAEPPYECSGDDYGWLGPDDQGRLTLGTAHTPIFQDGNRIIYRQTKCWQRVEDDHGRQGWIYDVHDVFFLAEQMTLAKAYGLDGFALSVHGDNPVEMAYLADKALPAAQQVGFRIAALYEAPERSWTFDDERDIRTVIEHLTALLDILNASPAAMRVQHQGTESVVVFVDPALPALLPDPNVWKQIRSALEATGIPFFLWSGPGASPQVFLAGFDGLYNDLDVIETLEVGLGLPPYNLRDERRLDYRATAWMARERGMALAFPAVLGWEGTEMRMEPGTFELPRDYGAPGQWGTYYRVRWEDALEHRPDWVVITSWNEWAEGTELEPSDTYPPSRYDFLQATWLYACLWRGGTGNCPTP